MKAGSLEVEMFANLVRLQQDMTKAKGIVTGAAKDINGALEGMQRLLGMIGVAVGAGAMIALAKHTIDALSHMKELGQEAGVTASQISRFEAPARAAGSSLDSVAAMMFKLSQAALESKDPLSKSAAAFRAIGISTKDIKDLRPDQLFELTARKLDNYSDGLQKNGVMQALFSKSGREASRVVAEIAERTTLAATVTDEEAEAANRLNNQITELHMNSEKYWRSIMSDAVPAMNEIVKAFIEASKRGGIFQGIISGLAQTFEEMNGKDLKSQLGRAEDALRLAQNNFNKLKGSWRETVFTDDEMAKMKADIAKLAKARDDIRKLVFDEEMAEQNRRALKLLPDPNKKKPAPKFDPGSDAEIKLYTSALQKLEMELGKLGAMSEVDKIVYETTKGSLMRLTEEHKKHLIQVASQVDLMRAAAEGAKSWAAALDYERERMAAASETIGNFHIANQEMLQQIQFEINLLGKSEKVKRTQIALRQLEIQYLKASSGLEGKAFDDLTRIYNLNRKQIEQGIVSQKAQDELAELLDPDRVERFGAAWENAFGHVGKAVADLMNGMEDYKKKLRDIEAMREVASKIEDPVMRRKAEMAINERAADAQIDNYANIAGAAKGFFKEGTTGYKALQAAETTFRAFQLASDLIKGVSAAAVAVANQAQGDPYTAWARMALMAAAMASLGFVVGGFGGSAAPHEAASVARQAEQGTGTVLGDSKAKSESIANALEHLRDNSSDELLYQSAMLKSLREIESSMKGLAMLAARMGLTGQNVELPGGGGGNTFSLDDSGLILGNMVGGPDSERTRFQGQSVGGLINNPGASQYTDIARTHSGAFGSSYTAVNRDFAGLSADFSAQISLAATGIRNTLASAIQILTGSTHTMEEVTNALNAVNIDVHTISFAGLKGDEIQAAIESVFGAIGDDMAQGILSMDLFSDDSLDALTSFQHVGEGAFETIVRVASGVERATAVLNQWGIDIIDWRDIVDQQGDVTTELIRGSIVAAQTTDGVVSSIGELVDAFDGSADDMIAFYERLQELGVLMRASAIDTSMLSQAMITAAGGLTALEHGLEIYSTRFFTQAEREAAQRAETERSFQRLNIVMPTTRAGFRALVEAAQAAGDETLVGQLLALAPAFDEVASASEDAAQRMTDAWADVEDLIAKLTGRSEREMSQNRLNTLANQFIAGNSQFAGMTPDQLVAAFTTMTRDQFAGYDDATRELIKSILGLAVDIRGLDQSVQAGLTVGDVQEAARTAAEQWFDKMKGVFSTEDYGTNQENLAAAVGDKVTAAQAHLTAVLESHRLPGGQIATRDINGNFFADIIDAQKQLEEYKKMLEGTAADLARYYTLEAMSPGHGKDLMDLEDWYAAQKRLVGENQAALLALEEIYQKKRAAILEDAVDGLGAFLKGLLTGPLSTLSNDQKLAELKKQYEGALAAGDNSRIESSAQAYLQLARDMYASSPAYNAIFTRVFDEINGLIGNSVQPPWQTAIESAMPTTSPIASQGDMHDLRDTIVEVVTDLMAATVEAVTMTASSAREDNQETKRQAQFKPFGTVPG